MDAKAFGKGIGVVFEVFAAMIAMLYFCVISLLVSLVVAIGIIVYMAFSTSATSDKVAEVPAVTNAESRFFRRSE